MPALRRRLAGLLLATSALGTGGCTLVKPLTGAIAGPFVLLANSDGHFCGCEDGRAILVVYAGAAAICAAVGLVTGIVSDVQWLAGEADEPTANWANPFKTNTDERQ